MQHVKRPLRIGLTYVLTKAHGPTADDLVGKHLRVEVQEPDAHLPPRVLAAQCTALSGKFANTRVYVQGQFRLFNEKTQTVCHCKAYGWPHRLGSGPCWGLSQGPFCGSCGRPTQAVLYSVSVCCSAKLFKDAALDEEIL